MIIITKKTKTGKISCKAMYLNKCSNITTTYKKVYSQDFSLSGDNQHKAVVQSFATEIYKNPRPLPMNHISFLGESNKLKYWDC